MIVGFRQELLIIQLTSQNPQSNLQRVSSFFLCLSMLSNILASHLYYAKRNTCMLIWTDAFGNHIALWLFPMEIAG